jgi:hypothetical protein
MSVEVAKGGGVGDMTTESYGDGAVVESNWNEVILNRTLLCNFPVFWEETSKKGDGKTGLALGMELGNCEEDVRSAICSLSCLI